MDKKNDTLSRIDKKELEKVKEFFAEKTELEKKFIQMIVEFEEKHGVIIDSVRFQRVGTRTAKTIYTDLSIVLP